jgi:hypothetical protein
MSPRLKCAIVYAHDGLEMYLFNILGYGQDLLLSIGATARVRPYLLRRYVEVTSWQSVSNLVHLRKRRKYHDD